MLRAHRAQSYYAEKALTQPSNTRPEAISHRGAHQTLPENSIPAFERAIDLGAQAIELDVHGTRDGIVVVHHDATIDAPDDRHAAIAELTADQLKRYPLAGGVEVPTLSAVLAAVGDRVMTYIEIKARNIEPLVVRCIRESSARCAVHSFDHRIVRNVKAIFPAIPTGVLQVARLIDPVASLLTVAARDLWQEASFIDEDLVARAHRVNARVIAWTSDDPRQWEALAALGVDGICTNRIAELATQRS
jgi:glycerophosphoryl diester phosphodiesterase